MKLKLPNSTKNWTSLVGATIAVVTLLLIFFLILLTLSSDKGGAYLGLVTYIILPPILIIGLILIPVGMYFKRKQLRIAENAGDETLPFIDLNIKSHRTAFFIFSVGTVVFLFLSAFGSYEAFNYTESVKFCGTTCHYVMKPEYTAYQNSPHARVSCAECHVGEGVDWYIRSKLSGLHQVYSVTLGTIEKPIKTPISNLRPARETCERCHWPEKFYSRNLITRRHYLSDEENSEWDIGMTLKVGGKLKAFALDEGIHWHINSAVEIQYIATDYKRQNIPWIKYTNKKSGKVTVFQDVDEPLSPGQMDSLSARTLDCIDCHNHPAHIYNSPTTFINTAINKGEIAASLPMIKAKAVEVCSEVYSTTDSAMLGIDNKITNFYKEEYPNIYKTKLNLIKKSINGIKTEFGKNIFPEMKVRWEAYPNNIGHMESKGCFRCHDGNHETESGKVISRDCNSCHNINEQGYPSNLAKAEFGSSLKFVHPGNDVEESDWMEGSCIDCHGAEDN